MLLSAAEASSFLAISLALMPRSASERASKTLCFKEMEMRRLSTTCTLPPYSFASCCAVWQLSERALDMGICTTSHPS